MTETGDCPAAPVSVGSLFYCENLFTGQDGNLLKFSTINLEKISGAAKQITFLIKTDGKAENSLIVLDCSKI